MSGTLEKLYIPLIAEVIDGEEKHIVFNYRPNSKDRGCISDIFQQNHYYFTQDMSGMVVMDVGAHIGSASLLAACRGAKVYAYEPMAENFAILQKNIAENKLDITPFQMGVGIRGTRVLRLGKNQDCSSLYLLADGEEQVGEEQILVVPLESALINIPQIDILKLDCEGAEWEIFPEIEAGLHSKINMIVGEIHPKYRPEDGKEPTMYRKEKLGEYVYRYTHA